MSAVTKDREALLGFLSAFSFHPSASHVPPEFRDGYNHAVKAIIGHIEGQIRYDASHRAASGAPQEAPGEAPSDSQMLDWLAEQWRDGLHLEACAAGGPTVHGLRSTATVYVGNQRFDANTPREAIRAAMKGPQ